MFIHSGCFPDQVIFNRRLADVRVLIRLELESLAVFAGSAGVCGRRVCGDAAVSDAVLSGADAGGDESVGRRDPDLSKLLQRVLQATPRRSARL